MPSFSRLARMSAVSSGVPVTTCTLEGLHSATAPDTNSATDEGREGMEARDRAPTEAVLMAFRLHGHMQTLVHQMKD